MPNVSMYCRVCKKRVERHHNASKCLTCGGQLARVPWDELYCELHNTAGDLLGNTQAADLVWLAQTLWGASRLGAGDLQSVGWLIGPREWEELGLTPQALLGDGPRHWDAMSGEQQATWIKLARIVMYVLPAFADRIGHRFLLQAKAFRVAWQLEGSKR